MINLGCNDDDDIACLEVDKARNYVVWLCAYLQIIIYMIIRKDKLECNKNSTAYKKVIKSIWLRKGPLIIFIHCHASTLA